MKQPEIIKITITIEEEEIEKNYLEGDQFELITPEAVEGKVFKHWSVNNKTYSAGETITLTSNTEIVAIYVNENDITNNNNNTKSGSKTGIIIVIVIVSCVVIAGAVCSCAV